jgi:ATP-dependent DNA helicase RecG
MITQQELEQILANPESYRAELTTSTSDTDKFCQAICAFANDLPGDGKYGYLILVAENNGKLSGLKVDDRLLLKITDIRTEGNILPQPTMVVERFVLDGGELLVAEVKPSEFPPVRYRGRVWVRIGPSRRY